MIGLRNAEPENTVEEEEGNDIFLLQYILENGHKTTNFNCIRILVNIQQTSKRITWETSEIEKRPFNMNKRNDSFKFHGNLY